MLTWQQPPNLTIVSAHGQSRHSGACRVSTWTRLTVHMQWHLRSEIMCGSVQRGAVRCGAARHCVVYYTVCEVRVSMVLSEVMRCSAAWCGYPKSQVRKAGRQQTPRPPGSVRPGSSNGSSNGKQPQPCNKPLHATRLSSSPAQAREESVRHAACLSPARSLAAASAIGACGNVYMRYVYMRFSYKRNVCMRNSCTRGYLLRRQSLCHSDS